MKQLPGIFLAVFVLLFSLAAKAATGDTLSAVVNGVNVYDAPSTAAQLIMKLDQGRKLKELRREGPWIKVIIYGELGKDGWVHSSSVAPLSTGTEKAPEPDVSAGKPDQQARKASSPPFMLVVKGAPQRFRGRCRLVNHDGATKEITIVGRVPKTYAMNGKAVRCRVDRVEQRAGTLRVELYAQGRSIPLGANQTSAAFGCVHVRSNGPWGKAFGRRCSRVAIF